MQFGNTTVLSNISLSVQKGEYIGLIGPNGAGKSTLLQIILGNIPPTTGVVIRKKNISFGYVPQDYFLHTNFSISVEEVIGMASTSLFLWKTKHEKKRCTEVLQMVGLDKEFGKRNFQDLSGGQKQRVIIARSLFNTPDVLLFDEPLSGVDFATKIQIYELLADLNTQYSTTIIFVSHEIESVISKCNKIFCINKTMHNGCHPMEFSQNTESITPIHHHHSLTKKA